MGGLTDAQSMALEMFKDKVPCILALNGDCEEKAKWLVKLEHLGEDCGDLKPNPCPFCEYHKNMVASSFDPFWQTFMSVDPPTCDHCDTEITIGEVTPI